MKRFFRFDDAAGRTRVALLAALLAAGLGVGAGLWLARAQGPDTDGDGMSDEYENLFGLNPNDPGDASANNDGDSLTNAAEAALWSDPHASDTDRDGWNDDSDSNALSRAYIDWGDGWFTDGDDLDYTGPAWWLRAFREDGDWVTNAPSHWHVPAATSNGVGSLFIDVDRSILTNNVMLEVNLYDHTNAVLYVDLVDTNHTAVVTNLFGNVLSGSNQTVEVLLEIPLTNYASAAGIQLRRESGEITIYESLLYRDFDQDGLDTEQEQQLGTSDTDADSDDDGLSDYAEVFTHGTNPLSADSDSDGMPDGWEVQYGLNPNNANDAGTDLDSDGTSNLDEYIQGRDPTKGVEADTSGLVNLKVYTELE